MLQRFHNTESNVSRITAQIYEENMKGNVGKEQPWRTYLNHLEVVLKKARSRVPRINEGITNACVGKGSERGERNEGRYTFCPTPVSKLI